MGRHTAPVDFDLIPLNLKGEVSDRHVAEPVDTHTTPLALPLLPSTPMRSAEHQSAQPSPVAHYAQPRNTGPLGDLAALLAAPRYRRTGATSSATTTPAEPLELLPEKVSR